MRAYEKLAGLPIEISDYELEDRDRTYGEFTRPSTLIPLGNCAVPKDQRGTQRPQGPKCDIGSFEKAP